MERYPDIEIYLACSDVERLKSWLDRALETPTAFKRAGKGQWRGEGRFGTVRIPMLFIENAADGFASLWIDSDASPWQRDVDCARAASQALGIEVRCSLGGWQPGDDPDRFFRVAADGSEDAIDWPDSGH